MEAITIPSYGGMEVSKETLKCQLLMDYEREQKTMSRTQKEIQQKTKEPEKGEAKGKLLSRQIVCCKYHMVGNFRGYNLS